MSYASYPDERPEHECPTPLQRKADTWAAGDQFWSPAGRWETITDIAQQVAQIIVQTQELGPGYSWSFWPSDTRPSLARHSVPMGRYVVAVEERAAGKQFTAWVGPESHVGRYPWVPGHEHVVVSAAQQRGAGWVVVDHPNGAGEQRRTQVSGKAAARSAVNRLAKEHAKKLGLPLWQPATSGGSR